MKQKQNIRNMLIFAHRGLELEYPGNTMPAFAAAAELGFGIELDVRLGPDDELVCIHDRDLDGMPYAPKFGDVAKQIISRFGDGQKAAIHVKADEQGKKQLQTLLNAFQKYQLHTKALMFDLTFETAEYIRKEDARIEIAVSVGEKSHSPTIYTWEQAKERTDVFDAVWWDEWKISESLYTEQMAKAIHATGKRIYAISPELHGDHEHAKEGYENDWKNFVRWSVEGVCTSHPQEFQLIANKAVLS